MSNITKIDWRHQTDFWCRCKDVDGLYVKQEDYYFEFMPDTWYCVEYECDYYKGMKMEMYEIRNGLDYLYLYPKEFMELFDYLPFDIYR